MGALSFRTAFAMIFANAHVEDKDLQKPKCNDTSSTSMRAPNPAYNFVVCTHSKSCRSRRRSRRH